MKPTPTFEPEGILPPEVRALDERERFVIGCVFWDRRLLHEIAAELGVSVRTVRRIRDKAVENLRDALDVRD